MTLFQVDDEARLFISPVIEDWAVLTAQQIDVVIDMEGGLDECVPTLPGSCLYVYFRFTTRHCRTGRGSMPSR